MQSVLDVNKDGVLDEKDIKHAYNKVRSNIIVSLLIFTLILIQAHEILSYNMPTGGGFTAGLVMGLRA